jgi:hypothetical protein
VLISALLAALVGAALLGAAALKVADRTGTAVAAETFGLRGRAARWAWLPLAGLEAALAAALLAGPPAVAWAAAAVLATFGAAQAGAIAAGRAGAPCGCFGARGHLSWASVTRAALLAAAAALLALGYPAAPPPPLVPALAAALVLAAAIVLRARRPGGALEVEGEGPPLGARLDLGGDGARLALDGDGARLDLGGDGARLALGGDGARLDLGGDNVRLALFVADGCRLCRGLIPQARRLGGAVLDEVADADVWSAANVPGAPFAVALAPDGTVLAKGTVNTRGQLASVLQAAHSRHEQNEHPERSSRRRFLATASAAVAALTAGRMVGALVAPGDAEAFHFCGHIYTTDGCPHPTGLPRIDSHGYPLRAQDGKPVDDLGRLIDETGAPTDSTGAPLLDPDGRPQPPATRTRVCTAAGKRYGINVRTDGAWYRCCNGHVRKLMDCCTTSSRRINGDRALRGYCYGKRHVFCVMFFQTKVPC